jgi:hypothetical protein
MLTIEQQTANLSTVVDNLLRNALPRAGSVHAAVAYIAHVATPAVGGGILALPAPSGQRARHRGVAIMVDDSGYFAEAGAATSFGYADTVDEIRAEIDDHFAEEAEHYRDQDTPADTPSLDDTFAELERADDTPTASRCPRCGITILRASGSGPDCASCARRYLGTNS